jgi:hypothetical protein
MARGIRHLSGFSRQGIANMNKKEGIENEKMAIYNADSQLTPLSFRGLCTRLRA